MHDAMRVLAFLCEINLTHLFHKNIIFNVKIYKFNFQAKIIYNLIISIWINKILKSMFKYQTKIIKGLKYCNFVF